MSPTCQPLLKASARLSHPGRVKLSDSTAPSHLGCEISPAKSDELLVLEFGQPSRQKIKVSPNIPWQKDHQRQGFCRRKKNKRLGNLGKTNSISETSEKASASREPRKPVKNKTSCPGAFFAAPSKFQGPVPACGTEEQEGGNGTAGVTSHVATRPARDKVRKMRQGPSKSRPQENLPEEAISWELSRLCSFNQCTNANNVFEPVQRHVEEFLHSSGG